MNFSFFLVALVSGYCKNENIATENYETRHIIHELRRDICTPHTFLCDFHYTFSSNYFVENVFFS